MDLTLSSLWISQRVIDWNVVARIETLSDHMYVCFSLETGLSLGKRAVKWPRWNLNTFNKDMLRKLLGFVSRA